MDPYICCLLGICCPPEAQFETLVAIRLKRSGGSRPEAERAVKFDLAMVEAVKDAMKKGHQ